MQLNLQILEVNFKQYLFNICKIYYFSQIVLEYICGWPVRLVVPLPKKLPSDHLKIIFFLGYIIVSNIKDVASASAQVL